MTLVQDKKPGREFSRRAFRLCLQLDRSDVFCLEALGPLGEIKFDCLAFLQARKPPAWMAENARKHRRQTDG